MKNYKNRYFYTKRCVKFRNIYMLPIPHVLFMRNICCGLILYLYEAIKIFL